MRVVERAAEAEDAALDLELLPVALVRAADGAYQAVCAQRAADFAGDVHVTGETRVEAAPLEIHAVIQRNLEVEAHRLLLRGLVLLHGLRCAGHYDILGHRRQRFGECSDPSRIGLEGTRGGETRGARLEARFAGHRDEARGQLRDRHLVGLHADRACARTEVDRAFRGDGAAPGRNVNAADALKGAGRGMPRGLGDEALDRERASVDAHRDLPVGDLEAALRLAHHEVLGARRAGETRIGAGPGDREVGVEVPAQPGVGAEPGRERFEVGYVGREFPVDGRGTREFPSALAVHDEAAALALDAADTIADHVDRAARAAAHDVDPHREVLQSERKCRLADAQIPGHALHVDRALEALGGVDVPVARDHEIGARQRAEPQAAREILDLQPRRRALEVERAWRPPCERKARLAPVAAQRGIAQLHA